MSVSVRAKKSTVDFAVNRQVYPGRLHPLRPKASMAIPLLHFLNSFQDVYQAASYSKGGRKTRKISSGSSFSGGMPGIKPMPKPASTKKIG